MSQKNLKNKHLYKRIRSVMSLSTLVEYNEQKNSPHL